MDLLSTAFGLDFSKVQKNVSGTVEKPFCRALSIPARKIILINDYLGFRIFIKCEFLYETPKPTLMTKEIRRFKKPETKSQKVKKPVIS